MMVVCNLCSFTQYSLLKLVYLFTVPVNSIFEMKYETWCSITFINLNVLLLCHFQFY